MQFVIQLHHVWLSISICLEFTVNVLFNDAVNWEICSSGLLRISLPLPAKAWNHARCQLLSWQFISERRMNVCGCVWSNAGTTIAGHRTVTVSSLCLSILLWEKRGNTQKRQLVLLISDRDWNLVYPPYFGPRMQRSQLLRDDIRYLWTRQVLSADGSSYASLSHSVTPHLIELIYAPAYPRTTRKNSSSILIPLASSQRNLYDIYLFLCVQYWTPDNGQKTCPKHVEFYSKSVYLVGLIIRIYHDARSSEYQMHNLR